MDKREKTEKIVRWIVFAVVALLFIGGLLAEFLLKIYYTIDLTKGIPNTIPSGSTFPYLMNRTAICFGDEALYLWALPIFGLNIMKYMPKETLIFFLRWLPYAFLFLMPVIAAPLKRFRQIPLLIVGVFSFLQGAGILLTGLVARDIRFFTPVAAVPFFIEAVLMILTAIALWTKSKPFAIVMGVICILFSLVSPLITATYSAMLRMSLIQNRQVPFQIILRQILQFPANLAISSWPLFKGISIMMTALLAFTAPMGFVKKAKKQ